MKILKKSSIKKNDEIKMLEEMNILKKLDHPNIIKLYEFFKDEDSYYLIMEYYQSNIH